MTTWNKLCHYVIKISKSNASPRAILSVHTDIFLILFLTLSSSNSPKTSRNKQIEFLFLSLLLFFHHKYFGADKTSGWVLRHLWAGAAGWCNALLTACLQNAIMTTALPNRLYEQVCRQLYKNSVKMVKKQFLPHIVNNALENNIYYYTLNKIINFEQNHELNSEDLRLFLCTQKAYFSQILFTNLSKPVLVSTSPFLR